jgi:hypothetical protein
VQVEGSDSLSAAFETLEPNYLAFVEAKLPEKVAFTGNGLSQLDPSRLFLSLLVLIRVRNGS